MAFGFPHLHFRLSIILTCVKVPVTVLTGLVLALYFITVPAIMSLHVIGLNLTHEHRWFWSKTVYYSVTNYAGV